MCVLTRDEILKEIEAGRLRIEPLELDQIGPASIDLHLGDELRIHEPDGNGPVHLRPGRVPELPTRVVGLLDHHVLAPGETVLGITREKLCFPPNICGWLEGRSQIARVGLTVHVTSGFVHPGVQNHQVLEMSNVSSVPLAIHAGLRICQVVLERTEGEAVYTGRFARQDSP